MLNSSRFFASAPNLSYGKASILDAPVLSECIMM